METNKTIKKEFEEIAKAKIRQNRNLVISKDNLGFITIAQQIVVNEGGRETTVFLKGAIEIEQEYFDEVVQAFNNAKLSNK
jgi:hypothetical protein